MFRKTTIQILLEKSFPIFLHIISHVATNINNAQQRFPNALLVIAGDFNTSIYIKQLVGHSVSLSVTLFKKSHLILCRDSM